MEEPTPSLIGTEMETTSAADPSQPSESPTGPTGNTFAKPKRHRVRTTILIVAGLLFVGATGVATYLTLSSMRPTTASQSSTKTSSKTASITTSSTPTDKEITNTLSGIDGNMAQAATDQTNADSAMSDSDQQITVPTE